MMELDDCKAQMKVVVSVGKVEQNHIVKPKKLLCNIKTETNEAYLATQQTLYRTKAIRAFL